MPREQVRTDWMNDPKNLAIALLGLVVLLLGGAALRERVPGGFTAGAPPRPGAGDPVSVLDVILDRQGLRHVDFLLDRPVGEGRVGEALGVDPATVRPATGGVWRWQGANVLRFEPSGGLGMAMRYEIALVGERILPPGRVLAGQSVFEVVTDQFRVERLETFQEPTPEGDAIQLRGQVYFNYEVSPEALAAHMRLLDPFAQAPVAITFESYYPERVISFHAGPLRKEREARELQLIVARDLTPGSGNVRLTAPYVQTLDLGSSETLSVWEVVPEPGDPESRIVVRLSSPVDPQLAEGYVTVTPAAAFRVTSRRNELVLTGDFRPGTTVRLSLAAGLAGRDRAVLLEEFSRDLYLPDLEPALDFESQGMFLAASGNRTLAIESVNVEAADLIVERVYPNNLFYLFNSYSWMVWDQESYVGSAIAHALGDRVVESTLDVAGPRNRIHRTALDLEALVDTDLPGLYRIALARKGDYRAVQRWVLVTDVGLVLKRGEQDLLVWASSFADLRPIAGARVRVLSDQNQLIAQGQTDGRGLWHARGLDLEGQRPQLVVAERGGDLSFLLLDAMRVDVTGLDVAGDASSARGYQAYLYGERDIYRPGETARGVALVRDRRLQVPPSMPLRMRHLDPTGMEQESFRLDLGSEGLAPFRLEVPGFARTGGHVLELLAGEQLVGSYRFQVEEFVPDRIRVDIDVAAEAVSLGELLESTVRGTYLFGPPADGLAVETRARLEPRPFAPEGFEGFSFVFGERTFAPTAILESQGRLDAAGTIAVGVQLPEGLRVPSALQAVITARVQEQAGRGVVARRVVPVHPYPYYVGLRRSSTAYAEPGSAEELEFVVIDPAGRAATPRALRAELYRDEWQTVLRRTASGTFRYESTRDTQLVDVLEIDPASRGSFRMVPPELGAYRVVLADPFAGPAAEVAFTASGFGFSPWAIENPARVELELDRDEYRPGETATVQVRAPFAGRLLLTLERDGVTESLVQQLAGNTATLQLPVGTALRPNGYVTATVIRSAADLEPGGVGRAFGAVPIFVDRAANRIAMQVQAPEEMRPEGPLQVGVRAEPGAAVTVAAVDEGILQLIAQASPDPFEFFYRRLALGVTSHDSFSLLFPEVQIEAAAAVGGGDAAERAAQFVSTEGIRRVRPVAFWSGVVRADAAGRAEVSFDVPEFQGRLRVMAVASRGRRFGAASAAVRVRDPLVLLPTLPRFLAFGDRVRLPVGVRNDTGAGATVTLRLRAEHPDGTTENAEQRLEVASGQQGTAYFELQAAETAGQLKVELTAEGAGERTRVHEEIPVRADLPAIVQEQTGALEATVTELPPLDGTRFRPGATSTLEISATPLIQLSGQLRYLVRYPWGCLEQVTSRAFPLVWLGDLAPLLDPETFAAGAEPEVVVQEAIRRVATYQTFSGAFTMWPGGEINGWASVYAAHFLVEARRAGFHVGDAPYDRAMAFLRGEARSDGEYGDLQLQRLAYALYVLARAGSPEVGTMDYLRDRFLAAMTTESRALLAAAYAATGNLPAIEELVTALGQIDEIARQTGGNFGSPLRSRALVLLALLDAAPEDARVGTIARRLAREASVAGAWNTQESAFALLALGQLYGRGAQGQNVAGRVLVDGREVATFTGGAARVDDIAPDAAVTIELAAGAPAGAAYYTLRTRGIPTDEAFAPVRQGLDVQRTFLSREGTPVDLSDVRQGDLLAIRLRVRSLAGPIDNLVIQSLLPAGLEVENPRLSTTETLPWIGDASLQPDHLDLRDDRVVVFTSLPDVQWRTGYVLVRAVAPGTFRLPPVQAEAMYDPSLRATGPREVLSVRLR